MEWGHPQRVQALPVGNTSSALCRGLAAVPQAEEAKDPVSLLRDFAIIAHVDHGKTTLMDRLMSQCNEAVSEDRVMDSNALEKERGITISSKYTSFKWKTHTLNAVDTPGHADFGGEVERVLSMVDGCLLLVDALEGPLAQTKFVLTKALSRGLQPVLVLNKVDRPAVTEERCVEVEMELFDLFAALGASDRQIDFHTIYASARQGIAANSWDKAQNMLARKAAGEEIQFGMSDLLDAIVQHVPAPKGDVNDEFRMLVSMIERDPFLGRLVTGRVHSGALKIGDRMQSLLCSGEGRREEGRITKIFTRQGMGKIALEEAKVGDIVSIAGFEATTVTDTVCSLAVQENLFSNPIDPPTIKMTFGVNDSPLAGKVGSQLTGSKIGERLKAEAESNVSITLNTAVGKGGETFEVQGRGELQLGILIETMRREGYELSVSPPVVLMKEGETGGKEEPMEELMVQVEEQHVGTVIQALTLRKAELLDMASAAGEGGRTRLVFKCPARGLIGYNSVFAYTTSGSGIMTRSFLGYEPHKGPQEQLKKGSLISSAQGPCTGYALMALEPRGVLFVEPQMEVYVGMIVGEHSRDEDLEINPCKEKKLTNVRNKGSEEQVRLIPPRRMTLEEAIGYVASDEIIEVTPDNIRLRKRLLDANARKRAKQS
eukprot:CAMPEP_0196580432 /NCGR_PEP_ID=MMETSP1081-20130531/28625_1 /TAXON_ID=36882 /ORGANISM="Pyramimonas amylifera, Strain CCMP720" /LENGTH=657 /DNA_ID=CAMNT_0041900295 /DNA_START=132 /DNA_END=2106 /DNA_ORIENTATION=+